MIYECQFIKSRLSPLLLNVSPSTVMRSIMKLSRLLPLLFFLQFFRLLVFDLSIHPSAFTWRCV
jgi:hypothetical protein